VPLTLFLPLFIFFFGIGPSGKVAFGGVYAFFPVVITAIAAFANVDKLHITAARSMGASGWQMFRRVYFPSALPGILTGLRIAAIVCIASVLGAETVSAMNGLGRSIAYSGELMDSVQMFAWILYVVAIAIAINLVLTAAELRANARR
jgi:NitT/TauT family transport system permease protein